MAKEENISMNFLCSDWQIEFAAKIALTATESK